MNKRRGFSLLEVIIALTVITVSFVGITALVSNNLKSNLLNRSMLTANYLNTEAVEIVRNIRDSKWLQNYSLEARTGQLWGAELWPGNNQSKIVRVDYTDGGEAPWLITDARSAGFEGNELFLNRHEDGSLRYTHDSEGRQSNFARYVELKVLAEGDIAKYQEFPPLEVTAVTIFKDNRREREVRYSAILTDWKQGPL